MDFGSTPPVTPSEAATPPRSQTDRLRVQADRPRRRAARAGRPRKYPPGCRTAPRTHSRGPLVTLPSATTWKLRRAGDLRAFHSLRQASIARVPGGVRTTTAPDRGGGPTGA